jgi:hypothetical protein
LPKGSNSVLAKCANPECSARLKYLHDGALYVAPRRPRSDALAGDRGEFSAPSGTQIECFWLCPNCSRNLTIGRQGRIESKDPLAISPQTAIALAA